MVKLILFDYIANAMLNFRAGVCVCDWVLGSFETDTANAHIRMPAIRKPNDGKFICNLQSLLRAMLTKCVHKIYMRFKV